MKNKTAEKIGGKIAKMLSDSGLSNDSQLKVIDLARQKIKSLKV